MVVQSLYYLELGMWIWVRISLFILALKISLTKDCFDKWGVTKEITKTKKQKMSMRVILYCFGWFNIMQVVRWKSKESGY